VLTNDHVVEETRPVRLFLHDGRERKVLATRRDPKSDLALLVVEAVGLEEARWGDSGELEVGDWVLAVGQPFGLSGSVTAGIVSGTGRSIGISAYENLIQTDAAINPGNSGGPLVDLSGRVVGVNVAIKTLGGGYEGVGFAVPSARARRIAADLAEHGQVRRSYLGLRVAPVEPRAAEGLGRMGAVLVTGVVAGGPAERAGIRAGDVVLAMDGRPTRGAEALTSDVEFAKVGQPMRLELARSGERFELEIRPEPQPGEASTAPVRGSAERAADPGQARSDDGQS
jgi:S1-C subfamily serine protease